MSDNAPVFTVSQLNEQVAYLLENSFPSIWVEGEISNLSCPSSGHWYFVLKDERAQIRCAMFRLQNRQVNFAMANGLHLLLRVRVTLYQERGDYQLIVEHAEEAGHGALQRKFELLKMQLQAAGLFDEARKKPLPSLPKRIGIITSATGAALQDILHVLSRRMPSVPVIIYPTLVQGDEASQQLVKALARANQRQECDVLILARGGGSLEDLWPFNEEKVAYAIAASNIPIISGIGHQIDFTIADFVADVRAPTPSAAAELVVPDRFTLAENISQRQKQLIHYINRLTQQLNQRVDWLNHRLNQLHPREQLKQKSLQLQQSIMQLKNTMQHKLNKQQQQFQLLLRTLHNISPLATLTRGYAIAKRADNNQLIQQFDDIEIGDTANIVLNQVELTCIVQSKKKK